MYTLGVEKGICKASLSHWGTYPKTAWLETNPEWGINYIDSHYMVAVVGTLLEYNTDNQIKFYFDLGLTYTSKLSEANSSYVSFRENLGIAYD